MASTAHLREGDIIFTASPYYLYRKVAEATGCRASHVGILFRDERGGWTVAESKVPLSRYTPLNEFLKRSQAGWHEIRRVKRELTSKEISKLICACDQRMGRWYHLGFRYDSRRMFCSKFVYEVYERALGIRIGEIETFRDLLRRRPKESLAFWRLWYFGRIPWSRRTITPASQLLSKDLHAVPHL